METIKYKVVVNCITYNHALYIEDTMNGFCIQKTNFPFVCTIVDDCSTDGEQKIINDFLVNNFDLNDNSVTVKEETDDYVLTFCQHLTNKNCFFAVILLKYNHFQIDKSKDNYCKRWFDNAQYMAFCEGDDYWIDEEKLRKQVELLDNNNLCTMVISNGLGLHMSNNTLKLSNPLPIENSRFATTSEILIEKNGLIPTASICCRVEYYCLPEVFKIKHIGDKPLKMWCAINGMVYYDISPLVVHRVGAPGSFGQRVESNRKYAEEIYHSMTAFFKRFDKFTDGKYHDDVGYLLNLTEYKFYLRTGDYKSLSKCEFQKSKPFLQRNRTLVGLYLQFRHPRLYNLLKRI